MKWTPTRLLALVAAAAAAATANAQTPVSGLHWPSNTIHWAFAAVGAQPYGLATVTSQISDPAQQAAVTAGVQEWARVSGVTLVYVADPAQADILIGYGDPSNLIGEDLWYYNPSDNTYISDVVLLKDPALAPLGVDSSGQLSYDDGVELQQLTTHEFGAGLGLAEGPGTDLGSVMNHVLDSNNRLPDAADIAAIQSLYGPPAVALPQPAPAPTPRPTPVSSPTPKPLPTPKKRHHYFRR